MSLAKLSSFSVAAAILSLNLGYGATTDPVGAVSEDLQSGLQFRSVPFLKEVLYQGVVTSITDATIGLAGVPTPPTPAYVQVLDGTAVGEIATIASSGVDEVTVEVAVSGLQVSDTVAIREHMTLSDVGGFISAVPGDIVTLYNLDGTNVVANYFGEPNGWFDFTLGDVNDLPVMPGEGFVLNANGPRTATYIGSVSTSQVNQDYAGSGILSTVGTLDPVTGTTIGVLTPNAATGDILTVYSSVGGVLVTQDVFNYFNLPPAFVGWFNAADSSPGDDTLVATGTAVFMQGTIAGDAIHPPAYTE